MNLNEVYEKVDETLTDMISRLPPMIKERAEDTGYFLEDKDPDGYRILGRYMAMTNGPIIIYVGQIFELEEKGDLEKTLASCKQVYLHELGHHLGLGEWELDIRDL